MRRRGSAKAPGGAPRAWAGRPTRFRIASRLECLRGRPVIGLGRRVGLQPVGFPPAGKLMTADGFLHRLANKVGSPAFPRWSNPFEGLGSSVIQINQYRWHIY